MLGSMALSASFSSLYFGPPSVASWYFDGDRSPALAPTFSERAPSLRGSLRLGSVTETVRESVVSFYLTQGLTATDLRKLTTSDALALTPVGTIRARSVSDIPAGDRGTVYTLPVVRTVDQSPVPRGLF